MKKTYIQPSATAISLMSEGQLLSGSDTKFQLDTENKMNASDAYSNKQQSNGPWSGNIWDDMD